MAPNYDQLMETAIQSVSQEFKKWNWKLVGKK